MISDMEGRGVYSVHVCQLYQFVGKSARVWDSFDLDCVLQKRHLNFKSLNNYRYIGIVDFLQEIFIENSAINVELLNNRTGEITAGG